MTDQEAIDIIADKVHRWVTGVVWPHIGGVVGVSIAKLEAEGFTREEARFWVEALTVLQLHRMGYPMSPVWHPFEVPEEEIRFYEPPGR